MNKLLKVGVGREIINPLLGAQLAGYPVEDRPAKSINDDLTATSLLIEDENEKAVIISLTIAAIEEEQANYIKNMVGNELDINPENIIVSAIQTHSGPHIFSAPGWAERDENYCHNILYPAILKSAKEAKQNKKPCRIGIGTTQSYIGINRRQVTEDGRVILGQNPWGPFDPTMTVVRFVSEDGPIANIIHYGAHPTAAGANNEVTRDWPGFMLDNFEEMLGGISIFICGAVGDVGPRLSNGKTTGNGISSAREIGIRAGFDAIRAGKGIKEFRSFDLQVLNDKIYLPFRPPASLEVAEENFKKLEAEGAHNKVGMKKAEYVFWKRLIEEYNKNDIKKGRYFDQTIIRIGPVVFVPFPGEPFAEIILRIRELSPFQYTLCASTTNGALGYFVTRDSLHRGGYEVEVAVAFMPYIYAENIDDIFVSENIRLIRSMQ
jgi:hypothetical protein